MGKCWGGKRPSCTSHVRPCCPPAGLSHRKVVLGVGDGQPQSGCLLKVKKSKHKLLNLFKALASLMINWRYWGRTQSFSINVKALLACLHHRPPGSASESSFLPVYIMGGSDASSTRSLSPIWETVQVLVFLVPDSWFQPGPDLAVASFEKRNQRMRSLCFSNT